MSIVMADTRGIGLDTHKLRTLREKRGLNQVEAAKRIGVRVSRWHDIESGRKSNITLDTLDRIAKALGCKPADLLK